MWDLPGPGLEPVFPALAGGFPTTAPPGKSLDICIFKKAARRFQCAAGSENYFYTGSFHDGVWHTAD